MTAEKVVVEGRFRPLGDDAGLVMATTRAARQRTGKRRGEFAAAVNARSGRPLHLGAGSIEAFETGYAQPVVDVFLIMLDLGGLDLRGELQRFIYG